ncbi:hypothetical protein [Paracoccus seriniphilus]|uniref:hypothetical protein n=1 Tax=Paracoccus seriniphilus TaxID=184748 RepID=UPI000B780C8E|nr:hypothetical protein [Paracoccus seriniphilus]WCR12747.1 hypothetical protein JHW44_07130 [Paracoccus seriniphilus]
MSSRTTTSVVAFLHPFLVAGDYEVLADEDIMSSRGFAACRRTATFLLINWHAGKCELRAVEHRDLEFTLAQDHANANTNAMKNGAAALSPSEEQI